MCGAYPLIVFHPIDVRTCILNMKCVIVYSKSVHVCSILSRVVFEVVLYMHIVLCYCCSKAPTVASFAVRRVLGALLGQWDLRDML